MLKIYFFLKPGKLNWKNESPVYVRIWHDQDYITMATGLYITKERWDFTNKLRMVLRMKKEKILRDSLNIFQLMIENKFNEIIRRDDDFSLTKLKNELNGKAATKITALKIMEIYISYFSRKVNGDERSQVTLKKYKRSKDLLFNFLSEEYKKEDLGWKSLNSNFINNLELYLKYRSTFKGRIGIKNNSTVKYIRMYKTAFNYALKLGFPSLTESKRVRTDFSLDTKYDLPLSFYIKLSFVYNYDNKPIANTAKDDYVFQTTFGWKLD